MADHSRLRTIIALAAACAWPASAAALQLSDDFMARVSIQTSCLIAAANLDFGPVGLITGGETTSATVEVTCSAGTVYSVSFDPLASVTSYNGQMVNGGNQIAYSAALSPAGGSGTNTHTIFGVLLTQPTPAQGIYTDNRVVYLSY